MNKYWWIVLIILAVLGAGLVYRFWLLPEEAVPVVTGLVREITVVANQNEWRFVPEEIEVARGDRVRLTVVNQDDYDHGLGIDAFGISQRMPANSTIKVEFVATQPGDFPFYCSVPCGEGDTIINGQTVHRTHFDMVGRLHVKSLISETR